MPNIEIIIASLILAAGIAIWIACKIHYRKHVVADGHVGLLYRKGILVDALPAGPHTLWSRSCSLTSVDIRKSFFHRAGLQAFTADKVCVKIDVVLATQIVDAVKMARTVNHHADYLCVALETAVRDAAAGITADQLSGCHASISARIGEALAPLADAIGVHIHDAQVRDIARDSPVECQ